MFYSLPFVYIIGCHFIFFWFSPFGTNRLDPSRKTKTNRRPLLLINQGWFFGYCCYVQWFCEYIIHICVCINIGFQYFVIHDFLILRLLRSLIKLYMTFASIRCTCLLTVHNNFGSEYIQRKGTIWNWAWSFFPLCIFIVSHIAILAKGLCLPFACGDLTNLFCWPHCLRSFLI